jgi:L-aminopeptidase/D-esterase-like protein
MTERDIKPAILQKLGLKLGHYTDEKNVKGTTVFLAEKGAKIGIAIRGSNAATFNTPAYHPPAGDIAHAVVLTGGSTYGLESCFGVMQYLEAKGIGLKTRAAIIPRVTGAVIYDLGVGDSKVRPGKPEGYAAAQDASFTNVQQGNVGVGIGATTGKWFLGRKMKGGFGMALATLPHDMMVAAFVVTNSMGDVVNPVTGRFYADDGNYALDKRSLPQDLQHLLSLADVQKLQIQTHTTLAVIGTNIAMERNQLLKVAELAHDGMARAVFPVHSTMDGDTIFALSSLSGERKKLPLAEQTVTDLVGLAAQDAMMQAIKNSVMNAASIPDYPAYTAEQH